MFSDFKIGAESIIPKHPHRSLTLFLHIVHVIKCIRHNWLNFTNLYNTFIFPKFEECNLCVKQNLCDMEKGLYVSIPREAFQLPVLPLTLYTLKFVMHQCKIFVIYSNLINVMP